MTKCVECGRFMSWSDLDNIAAHKIVLKDTDPYSYEPPDMDGPDYAHIGCG